MSLIMCALDVRGEIMEFDEYQERVGQFADYPSAVVHGNDVKLVYPVLGLAEEVAELHEKMQVGADKAEIAKELGDVCWFVQEVASCLDIKMSQLSRTMKTTVTLDVFSGEVCGVLAKAVRDMEGIVASSGVEKIKVALSLIVSRVEEIASECGLQLQDVMMGNYNKLASRKARGVIHGSGDNR